MTLPKVTINTPGPSGMFTETFIDDQKIHGITEIDVHIGMEDPNRVDIRLLCEVMFTGQADAKMHLVLVDPTDGEILTEQGTSLIEILDELRTRLWQKQP
jgi:hypothetical protein